MLSFLQEKGLAFTGKNLSSDPALPEEMRLRTGQEYSPCVEIDGVMLVDVGREEVEEYLNAKGLI